MGKLICMALILTLLLVFLSFTLAFLVWLVSQGYQQATPVNLLSNYAIVIAFVGVDALVLLVLGLLVSIVSTSQSFLMVGVLGFMLIARSYSSVIELLGVNDYVVSDPDSYSFGLGGLRFFLPDLGALDVREIALYSNLELLPSGWPFLLYSSLSYAGLILFLAILALYKKRFS
ncbi:hypothetical protein [Pseudomonas sp. 5P_3.1_Bac2]|uniref:hypothetical protein n=1 Tax=Pseudomonas sp. 5P_3.1_Bac2 TaxID=2971617 RepID=UPI0021C9F744|nr:hypothetical protein [Pseudomonas sp. 5P_3.1_Bac2]MCU1718122.1 hypothetical protein [Pseudomonas sp. 5P_3.1_Bac2]